MTKIESGFSAVAGSMGAGDGSSSKPNSPVDTLVDGFAGSILGQSADIVSSKLTENKMIGDFGDHFVDSMLSALEVKEADSSKASGSLRDFL